MSQENAYSANPGKQLVRTVDGVDYLRIPIKTHLITKADDMNDVVLQYARDKMQDGDILFISEKKSSGNITFSTAVAKSNKALPWNSIPISLRILFFSSAV